MIKNKEEVKKKDGVFSEKALCIIKPGLVGPSYDTDIHIVSGYAAGYRFEVHIDRPVPVGDLEAFERRGASNWHY